MFITNTINLFLKELLNQIKLIQFLSMVTQHKLISKPLMLMMKTHLFLLWTKRKTLKKKKTEWVKLEMKSILEKEVKRTKIYLKTLMINLVIKLSLNKLLNHLPNHLFQLQSLMKTDHLKRLENQQISSILIKVNMIEILILLVNSIRIGNKLTTKEIITPARLILHLFNPTIFLFQMLGKELPQLISQNI